jgi:NTP pyrophosphatase (non-canonical NTP hydrolase)
MQIEDLTHAIRQFRDERDWKKFHRPKDLSAAIAIEAAELQEIFLWKTSDEIDQLLASKPIAVADEVADLAIYLLAFADTVGVDLPQAVVSKLEKNAAKYPVDKARSSAKKYTEL